MRPDEHKKKKNTAYKKKHGIGNKTPTSSSTTADASTSSSSATNDKLKTEAKTKKESQCETRHDHRSKGLSTPAPLGDTPRGSDSESEVAENTSFRRREIVSNWRKYDLEPENDGAVTSRGEDFEKLLNMAGEAMSRFRFKDEIEWEDEEDRLGEGDGGEQSQVGSGILSLDLADIVSSMSCIPIHQLLGIDKSLFPADQLESHIQSVAEKRKLYDDRVRQQEEKRKLEGSEDSEDSHKKVKDSSTSINHKTGGNDKGISGKTETNKVNETLTSHPSRNRQSPVLVSDINVVKDVMKVSAKQDSNKHSSNSISLMDDDLDQLLDMDVGKEKLAGDLNLEVADIHKEVPSADTKDLSTTNKGPEKEADDLEDWLDSILD